MTVTTPQVVIGDRLILGYLKGDPDAVDIAAAEVGDCICCWRAIADHFAEWLAGRMEREMGLDAAVQLVERDIAELLDAEDGDTDG